MSPLVNDKFLLEKYPGKGGWTFARIPTIPQNKKAPFGWVKVKGSIDGVVLNKYRLMPMGDGRLFLPVKAEIRKRINKQAGDYVHVILDLDLEPIDIPKELIQCIAENPLALKYFTSLEEKDQAQYVRWIYSAKSEATKIDRIATTVENLSKGKKYYKGKDE